MGLVTPDFGLLFWMVLSFAILLFLLKKFAWKPVLKMIKDREESIESQLNSAKEAKEQMERLSIENEKIMKEARAEREEMLREAKATKDKIVADAQNVAKIEADKIIAAARAEIQTEKESAMAELSEKVGQLSIEIAEKILRHELSSDTKQSEYMKDLVKNISLN
ncbi:MAG: F0F1 ATP synthase subunit B [Bacteroidales bacterium]|nr:F0F1 ATP synthase subunit B [Bacteroidales bacterium]